MIAALSNAKPKFIDPAAFTPHFQWRKTSGRSTPTEEHVFCEDVSLAHAVAKFGTPTYLYSRSAITDAFHELENGLGSIPHRLCFAVKANGNLSILKYLAQLGSGFDIVSGGELEHLRHIGVPGDRIVFSGVGKSREEIGAALNYAPSRKSINRGILLFNVESEAELNVLVSEAQRHVKRGNRPPAVSIRVNPDVLAGGHPHIATGRHEHKFGLDWAEARRLYLLHKDSRAIRWQGISAHIGSQIVSSAPFKEALHRLVAYVRELRSQGIPLRYLDFGGGLGVRYTTEKIPSRREYARMIAKIVRPLGMQLLLEPGRTIIASAGVLLTRVLYTKRNRNKTFVVVDAAMNDLLRPSLYSALHPITETRRQVSSKSTNRTPVDVVGPVCETGDCFLRAWPLGKVHPGDLLAIWVTGAYGMVLASNYNGRCRAPEVLVQGKKMRLIRRRETQTDLLRGDVLA
jgi:diaminopimelate decarboxylase